MTKEQAKRFLERQRKTDVATPCKYGHLDCSDVDGGACLDEVLGNFPELAE